MKQIRKCLFIACLLLWSGLILTHPQLSKEYAENALLLWFHQLLPCQFTAFLLIDLWKISGLTDLVNNKIGPVNSTLFGISQEGSFLLLSGLLFGFPSAAYAFKIANEDGKLSKQEGNLLLPFCNLFGPPFLFAYFYPTYQSYYSYPANTFQFALLYYGVHIILLWSVCNIRRLLQKRAKVVCMQKNVKLTSSFAQKSSNLPSLSELVADTLCKVGMLAGYMILFSTMQIVTVLLPNTLRLPASVLFEVGTGVQTCMECNPNLALACLMFGGISCAVQTKAVLKDQFQIIPYICSKLCIALLTYLFLSFII